MRCRRDWNVFQWNRFDGTRDQIRQRFDGRLLEQCIGCGRYSETVATHIDVNVIGLLDDTVVGAIATILDGQRIDDAAQTFELFVGLLMGRW